MKKLYDIINTETQLPAFPNKLPIEMDYRQAEKANRAFESIDHSFRWVCIDTNKERPYH